MGSKEQLSKDEQDIILRMIKLNHTIEQICRATGRSKAIVYAVKARNCVQDPKPRSGRPTKLTAKVLRSVVKIATREHKTTRAIAREPHLNVHYSTVYRAIVNDGGCKWTRRLRSPPLDIEKRNARKQFAYDHAHWVAEWRSIIWSDEKRFKLDGPDGMQHYWHAIDKEREFYRSRQYGGGRIMVWGAFTGSGKLFLVFITIRIDAAEYIRLMKRTIIRHIHSSDQHMLYQQDNASVHTAGNVKEM
ncbi:TC3A [Enterospora canceri]|uniref:TC3A n=1 Tax=Enterospora canceri TaxID=1081671 RepID=A0A1Y1S5G3_9MICR|nr:TC3A [Enterospora canceri]